MLAYLRVQLLHMLRGLSPTVDENKKNSKLKTVLTYIGIAVLMAYLYGIVIFMEYMIFDLLTASPMLQILKPEYLLLMLVLLASTMITLIYGFFSVNSKLFFSQDVESVAALPISGRSVLTVRMIAVWLSDALLTLLVTLPLAIMLGIKNGLGPLFYIKTVLTCACVPLIPLSIAMVLSFMLIRISALWKRREGVTVIFTLALFFGIIAVQLKLQNMSDADLENMILSLITGEKSLVNIILKNYPPLQWAADGIMQAGGKSWLSIGLFALVSAGAFVLVILLFGGRYLDLAVKQSEIRAVMDKGERKLRGNGERKSPEWALYCNEMRELVTVPSYITNGVMSLIMVPLMMGVCFYTIMKTGEMGEVLTILSSILNAPVAYTIMLGLSILTCGMSLSCTSVSREGKTHELRKTYPLSGLSQLLPKLFVGMTFNIAAIFVEAVALCILLPKYIPAVLLGFVAGQAANFLFNGLGLCMDAAAPKLNWKTEQEAIKSNMNTLWIFLIDIALCVGMVFLVIGVMEAGGSFTLAMGLNTLLLAILSLLVWLLLKNKASKSYFLH